MTRKQSNLGAIRLMTSMECKMIEAFNHTAVDYPTDLTIVDLFAKQVQANPQAIALTFAGENMTFQELDERSNQLGHYLRGQGVKEEELVAICVDRSFDMIVGLLGILKSGGAYVPIDPDYPSDRIDYIIENANAKFALSHHGYDCLFDNCEGLKSIRLDLDWSTIAEEPVAPVANDLTPDNLMYVIYTSGSTGKPKGVMNQHSGLVNRLLWTQGEYDLVAGEDVILQKTTFCFDVSVWELFWPLISGVRMVIAKPGGHKDSDYLRRLIEETAVTTMHFVPSMLEVFLLDVEADVVPSLRRVLCSGEALKPSHVAAFNEKLRHVGLHNLYGPTEAAIDVTYWAVPSTSVDKVPIGRPVANTQLYILDEFGASTGIGVPGELYLGGVQVARGYYNRPELTEERFIQDIYSGKEGAKLYKTGDLARWMPDGNVEYLGRMDHQVKIRGNRIELGEIETVIQLSPYATQCVVMAMPDPSGDLRLVAYVVPAGEFDKAAIQNFIRTKLPTYMVPSVMVALEEMPLTPNGKVDRKALPTPDITALQTKAYVAPSNATEIAIAGIWKDLLKVEQVGVNDNFFDLGGHSILATRTVSAIRKQLQVEIAIKDIFMQPTVALLAQHLTANGDAVLLPNIEALERPERLPLSFSQERLWFLDKLSGSVQYHLPGVLKFTGELDLELLQAAFQNVVNRHEVLRTVYREEEGVSYQEVLEMNQWSMDADVAQLITDEVTINNIIESAINKPFDLSNDHMLRAQVIKTGAAEHLLIFVMHHIASDGWSISLFIDELSEYYLAQKENRVPVFNALPIQYADYALWQRNYLEGEVLDHKLNYWTDQLQSVEPLNLPTDFSRPPIQSSKGNSISFTVDAPLTMKLNALSRREEATLYMLLLSAFKVMLQKYSGQEDITVGCPIANRMQAESEAIIGFFVNTLALRSDLCDDPRFVDLLAQVKATTLDAYANQEVPFEKIVDKVAKERDRSRNPIFQVMMTLHNNPDAVDVDLKDAQLSSVSYERTTSQFDLSFDMIETAEGLEVEIIYCTALFTEATINRMQQHFQKLLEAIVAQPEANIEALTMITEIEKTVLLESFNDTAVDYPQEETIVSLFEQQAALNPEATALYFEGTEMSFRDLDEKSNQLAHYLRKKGVKEEELVAICVDRSFDMIVGLMGIFKAGGAYVPIDPDYPQDRIDYIIENANANFAISHNGYDRLFARCEGVENVQLDQDWSSIAEESVARVANDLTPDNLMYVIYTSGSTGKPKGVMNQHSGLVNRLLWTQSEYNLQAGEDAILQKTTFCFDVSVWELFWPLISGVRMVIAKPGGHKDSDYLRDIIDEAGVTTMHFVPSMLEVFLLDVEAGVCNSLQRVLCSGEALKPSHVAEFKQKLAHVELHNLYGPTEAAIDVTYWAIPETKVEKVPIGKPVANTQLYILNKAGKLTALGVPGELYLAGVQVARGYYNRPDLTEERFVANPFSTEENAKMYKTGDLARWLPDGNIEYLGRIDNQVKIRGNRIELGEIELVMQQSPMVNQCVVLAKPDVNGNNRLVAYVVAEEAYDKEAVQTFLKQQVPEYMVPGILIEIPEVPLTPNGKIDRKALPEPEETTLSYSVYVAPRDEMEEQLANVWKKLLNVERVGIHDNFFELGGDSIVTIQAVSRAKRLGYTLKPRNMFDHQTIAELSAFIRANTATEVETEQGLLEGDAPLMPMQHLFFENEYAGMEHYNFSDLMKVEKSVESTQFDAAIKAIVAQHDALRFKYQQVEGVWIQTYGTFEGGIEVIDLRDVAEEKLQKAIEEACATVQKSLNLENGALLRVALMETPDFESHNRILIVAHHLGIDGVSWRILFEDFNRAMAQVQNGEDIDLGEKTSSFRQWSAAMTEYAASDKVSAEQDYWMDAVKDYQALPVDHELTEPAIMKDHHGARNKLNSTLTDALLKEVHHVYNTKIDDILLSALAMTVNGWGGQDKILIGMEGHGREDLFSELNVTKTMGWFTSIYPVLLEVNDPQNIGDLIKGVKERMRGIPQKGLGYGLLRFLHPSEEVRNSLNDTKWDILFNYLGQLDGTASSNEGLFSEADEYSGADTSENYPFTTKLEISGSIFQGELSIIIRYCRKLYEDATIDAFLAQYIANLETIIKHCLESSETQATPADFGLNGKVTFQEMDEFLNEHSEDDGEEDEDDVLLKF
ncbi:MAG: amino acid adenylation domain-containing protein [Bacteroidota bacterium]